MAETNRQVTIKLPKELKLSNTHELVERFAPAVDACHNQPTVEITLDMSDLSFVTPTGLATLTAAMVYIARSGCLEQSHVVRPKAQVDGYLTRMGFYESLQLSAKYPWSKRDSTGRFREVIEVTSEEMGREVTNDLVAILQQQATLSQQTVGAVSYTLSELIDNVFHHAQSPVNAIVCAQTYPAFQRIELAIVDCGRGIRLSLQDNIALRGRFTTAAEAISLAVQPKITGNPARNAGEGLFFLTELMKQYKGGMRIYSEDGLFRITKGQVTLCSDMPYWQGTIVSLRLGFDVDLVPVFNQYAQPEEDYKFLFDSDGNEIPF